MAHGGETVHCAGPDSPYAFDLVPLLPRNGALDARCPICKGHGQWNSEIDLVSFRCKRAICDHCSGNGWVETGVDPVALPDIVLAPEGYAKWITRFVASADLPQRDPRVTPLIKVERVGPTVIASKTTRPQQ